VDWQTALEYVANGLKQIKNDHGAAAIGALVSPHSTLEELKLAGDLVRGLGSQNIDYRLRNAEFENAPQVRWLGTSIASLSHLERVLVVGSNLRKDHPLFAQRIRQAAKMGCQVSALNAQTFNWALPVANTLNAPATHWVQALADIAAAVAAEKGVTAPAAGTANADAQAIAQSLLGGERKAILLGNAAAHHAKASSLLALANFIGEQTGATVGYLTEAANTVGAQLAGAVPGAGGLNAGQMLSGGLKAAILLNTEPVFDSAAGQAAQVLDQAEMVVTLSPFKTNLAFSDVLLPIAPFSETAGTFVNAEGRLQSFFAVVRPLAETRPAWKVMRVLANLLGLPGFEYEAAQDVLTAMHRDNGGVPAFAPAARLGNTTAAAIDVRPVAVAPVVASIYQLDSLVRRSTSLQLTADGRGVATLAVAQEALA
jgi:NADH-quinone oxidoreductase subunit G